MKQPPHPLSPQPSLPPREQAARRAQLERAEGPHYWRSLEELAQGPQAQERLEREFPAGASEWDDGVSRRSFLKIAAASTLLAGLPACTRQPSQEILPYVQQPEQMVLGAPLWFATALLLDGYADGVLVKSREGHPIKIEGNPTHPETLGGSTIWMQAALLDLYDPDRSQAVTHEGELSSWDSFLGALNSIAATHQSDAGAGLRFLTETITSPTLAAQLTGLLQRFPKAHWHQYQPICRDNIRAGAQLAFGEFVEPYYRFDKAEVIVSLESDFLYTHPARLRHARQFADGRRLTAPSRPPSANRLYQVESSPTLTGSMAQHRLPLASGQVLPLAQALAQTLWGTSAAWSSSSSELSEEAQRWLRAAAIDLRAHQGASILLAGEEQPPYVHALAHLLNEHLGNASKTVFYREPAEAHPTLQLQSLQSLVEAMQADEVKTLFILGGNPVYNAPADLNFDRALAHVPTRIQLGLSPDETTSLCTWHIPQSHSLESWSDARASDGTITILQPLIAPLYGGQSAHELLDAFAHQQPLRSDYEIVQAHWREQALWPDFDPGWRQALLDGFIRGTESKQRQARLSDSFRAYALTYRGENAPPKPSTAIQAGLKAHGPSPAQPNETSSPPELFPAPLARPTPVEAQGLEICFRPDPSLWDGRFANNGWLQECPRPLSKLTWDNALYVSPALAQQTGLRNEEVVEVTFQARTMRAPVWIQPGQASNTITLSLGNGRSRAGRVGKGIGFNAYPLRPGAQFWFGAGATLRPTGEHHALAATQTHHALHSPERQVYRAGTLREFLSNPQFVKESVETPQNDQTLYNPQEYSYAGYKWAMSIDLTTCIGCNACLVACNAENNIPVVGKDQVRRHREMFWIRIDTYYKGAPENPSFHHMPVPCMHCEHAPCELVCPVAATVHDHEGLNLQVYNRCVGTRFCSNNCPYKVRRFNFFQYAQYHQPSSKPLYNPEVTVRWRGVMEKCTYCVQRISAARINAEKGNRRIQEKELQTACQQACPTQAIIFGDLHTPDTAVARLKEHPLDYAMLGNLNTRPRTTYLAQVQNPNPNLEERP